MTTRQLRTYSELSSLTTIEERFQYLSIRGVVGGETFGPDRWINQIFYRSTEWRQLRNHIIVRDAGCDLGVAGFEVHDRLIIHHMNPMTVDEVKDRADVILDPEFLISTAHRTHNAIHYGSADLLPTRFVERAPGDMKLW